jgi:hypothetical protein
VVRVELDNGRRLVGLRYPEPLITEVSDLIRQQKLNAFAVGISFALTKYRNICIPVMLHHLAFLFIIQIQAQDCTARTAY